MTNNNNTTHSNVMNKTILEATEVSLSIYNQIDSYQLPEETRVKHKALGQVLRSLVEILDKHEQSKATA